MEGNVLRIEKRALPGVPPLSCLEQLIDRIDHSAAGTPIGIQTEQAVELPGNLAAGVNIGKDIGAAKFVNGLFRVADHDPATVAAAAIDRVKDVVLQTVGILEFIDHHHREAIGHPLRQPLAAARAVEGTPQMGEQIIRRQLPQLLLGHRHRLADLLDTLA